MRRRDCGRGVTVDDRTEVIARGGCLLTDVLASLLGRLHGRNLVCDTVRVAVACVTRCAVVIVVDTMKSLYP